MMKKLYKWLSMAVDCFIIILIFPRIVDESERIEKYLRAKTKFGSH